MEKRNSAFAASAQWGFLQSDSVGAAGDVSLLSTAEHVFGLRRPSAFVPILHCFSTVTTIFWF